MLTIIIEMIVLICIVSIVAGRSYTLGIKEGKKRAFEEGKNDKKRC